MIALTTKVQSLLFLFFFLLNFAFAQNDSKDPLQKPDLWSKIEKNPEDMRLWAAYVGKDLNSLTSEDEKNIVKWYSQVSTEFKPNILPEEVWMDVADQHHYDSQQKMKLDLEYKVFHKQLKAEILQESPVLQELSSNIETNFILIEDIIRLEFEELGTKYIDYASVYPKQDYPKDQWLSEKKEELSELKLLNLEILKATALNRK